MKNAKKRQDYDLDYYELYLRQYLLTHRFPEADDDLFITSRVDAAYDTFVASRLAGEEYVVADEKATAVLMKGVGMSAYDFISGILLSEFSDRISLAEESIEFWSLNFIEELSLELKGVELSEEYLETNEGAVFKLTVIGRMELYFEENGL